MSDDRDVNIDIELGKSVRRHIEHKKSPLADPALRALPYDQPESDQTPVFVAENVMRSIEELVLRDKEREVGGVLLGGFYRNEKGSFVEITDFIEAKSAEGTDVSLTFTHEAWEQINAEQATRGPGAQIVGWYHSHPALGVFMSKEDEFIHSSFFTDPWHVAMVVDPIYHNWGCFKWKDGALERTGGVYIFAEKKAARRLRGYVKTLSDTKRPAPRDASASADRSALHAPRSLMRVWLVVAVLVLAQVVTAYFAFTGRGAPGDATDYYETARYLLSRSDMTGGELYLRLELVDHPGNEGAQREWDRLNAILADPEFAELDDARFDRTNFELAMADRAATEKVEYGSQSEFGGLGILPGEQDQDLSLAPADAGKKALEVYERAASTREARIERAEVIRDIARRQNPKVNNGWWDAAVRQLKQEHLREIAYAPVYDKDYKQRYDKLSDSDRKVVDGVRAKLVKSQ